MFQVFERLNRLAGWQGGRCFTRERGGDLECEQVTMGIGLDMATMEKGLLGRHDDA